MPDKKAKFPTRPSLVGRKVFLRPATPEDIANIEYWTAISQPESLACRPQPFRTPAQAAENYRACEKTTVEQKFAVVRKEGLILLGEASFFNYNPLNRSAELGVIIDPDERKKGYGREALQLLTRFLFKYRGLNKVYAQTAAFNKGAVALLESLGFQRDAILRQHYFFEGEFHNGVIYSLLLFELNW